MCVALADFRVGADVQFLFFAFNGVNTAAESWGRVDVDGGRLLLCRGGAGVGNSCLVRGTCERNHLINYLMGLYSATVIR